MTAPRTVRHAARFLLAWFALVLAAAAASPLMRAGPAFALVCSGGGLALLEAGAAPGRGAGGDGGDGGHGGSGTRASMDCPLCAGGGAPPPSAPLVATPSPRPVSLRPRGVPAVRLAVPAGAPLPARGPPVAA